MEKQMGKDTIKEWFEATVTEHGRKKAISFFRDGTLETQLSYTELNREIDQFARLLLIREVRKGDRVILLIDKSLTAVVATFALQKIGAIAVPLNPGFKQAELEYLFKDADAKLILLDPEKKSLIRKIDPDIQIMEISSHQPYQDLQLKSKDSVPAAEIDIGIEDPGLIIYTSGTTGNPKGAVLTNSNLVGDARNVIEVWQISDQDALCHALPLFHVHGLCFALFTSLLSGSHVLMLDRFDPAVVVETLSRREEESSCSIFMAVPAMYTKILDFLGETRPDFSHLRLLTSGSAPLLEKEFGRIKSIFGMEPVEREGMSETGMNFSNPINGKRKPGSIGVPLTDVQVRIVDPDTFQDVESGRVGELWLKGRGITTGYWRKPEETAETFKDGWFRTGDLGKIDEDGYYYLTDRIKHIIISGGENVSAKEVESVINRVEGVIESSVVGKPDEKWGEKVVAAVVTAPESDLTEAGIKTYCRENLHDWKCPKQIRFVDALPRNTMGKVLKEELKKLFN